MASRIANVLLLMLSIRVCMPSDRRTAQLVLTLAVCLTCCMARARDAASPADRPAHIQARRSYDFAASLGVNTHFSQRTPHYRDERRSAADLRYLGIAAIRDGCTTNPATVAIYRALVRVGVRLSVGYNGVSVAETVAAARELARLGPGALLAIEGPNEINNWPVKYEGRVTRFKPLASGGTFLPAAQLQAALYAAVRRDPVLATIPVWDLTDGGAEPDNSGLQFLTVPRGSGTRMPDGTVFADVANIHAYPSGGEQAQGAKPEDDWLRKELMAEYELTWGGRHFGEDSYKGYPADSMNFPAVVTEFGYHSNAPAGVDGVDRVTQAKNLLNAILGAWADGYHAFFVYELYDEAADASDEGNYGLFDATGRAKPATEAIHALTTLLADRGSSASTFTPGEIEVTLSDLPETARWTGLQGSDGLFRLIVWNNATNWDAASRRPLAVASRSVTLRFGRSWPRVTIFDPTKGTDEISHHSNVSQATLSLTDHPLIVTLSTQAAD